MLGWSLVFAALALIAAWFGYTGVAGVAADIAWVLCFIFLGLMVVGFIVRAFRGESVD